MTLRALKDIYTIKFYLDVVKIEFNEILCVLLKEIEVMLH